MTHYLYFYCCITAAIWPLLAGDKIQTTDHEGNLFVRKMKLKEYTMLVMFPSLLLYSSGMLFH